MTDTDLVPEAGRERDRDDIKHPFANIMRDVNLANIKHLRFSPLKETDRALPGHVSEMLLRLVAYKQALARKMSDQENVLIHELDPKKRRKLLNTIEDLKVRQTFVDAYYYMQLHNDLEAWEGPPFVTLRTGPDRTVVAVISASTEQEYARRTSELFAMIDQRIEKEGLGIMIGQAFEEQLRGRMNALNQPYHEP